MTLSLPAVVKVIQQNVRVIQLYSIQRRIEHRLRICRLLRGRRSDRPAESRTYV